MFQKKEENEWKKRNGGGQSANFSKFSTGSKGLSQKERPVRQNRKRLKEERRSSTASNLGDPGDDYVRGAKPVQKKKDALELGGFWFLGVWGFVGGVVVWWGVGVGWVVGTRLGKGKKRVEKCCRGETIAKTEKGQWYVKKRWGRARRRKKALPTTSEARNNKV